MAAVAGGSGVPKIYNASFGGGMPGMGLPGMGGGGFGGFGDLGRLSTRVPAAACPHGARSPRCGVVGKAFSALRSGRSNGFGGPLAARTGDMMRYAMDQLRTEGVPEDQLRQAAAHMVGQAQMESGLNPNAVHDGGTGYGIYGARDPNGRVKNAVREMLRWLKANGYEPNSAEGQMRYMTHEAMSDPSYGKRAASSWARDRVISTPTR